MDTEDPLDVEPTAMKSMVMFYLIDTSISMRGSKIGQVNAIMDEVIPEIRGVGEAETVIKIAVLQFDKECRWMNSEPESAETFKWRDLSANGKSTELGAALIELNDKMSRKEFLGSANLSYAPVIILLSDGRPTYNPYSGLKVIRENSWFKHALKIAIAIGDDANEKVLEDFTGNSELVIHTPGGKELADILKFVSVTSSQIGSRSRGFTEADGITPEQADQQRNDQMVKAIKQFGSVDPADIIPDPDFI